MVTFLNWLDALDRSVTRLVQAFLEMTGVIETLVGIVVGGLITWLVSYWYYKKAGDELRHEAERLRKLHELALYAQTNPGVKLQLIRDSAGNIIGLGYPAAGRTRIKAAMSGEMTIEQPQPKGPEAGS
jgi:hypothetical protein